MIIQNGKYSKRGTTLDTYFNQYCNRRKTCRYKGKNCSLGRLPKRIDKKLIAYIDRRFCKDYRTDEDGIIGADVIETGAWK